MPAWAHGRRLLSYCVLELILGVMRLLRVVLFVATKGPKKHNALRQFFVWRGSELNIKLGIRQKPIHDLLQADFVNVGSCGFVCSCFEGLLGLGNVLMTNAITRHLESIADEYYILLQGYG